MEQEKTTVEKIEEISAQLQSQRNSLLKSSFADEMNEKIEELYEQGFWDRSRLNKLFSNRIGQHAVSTEDYRYLDLIGEIKTGTAQEANYGQTIEGQDIKNKYRLEIDRVLRQRELDSFNKLKLNRAQFLSETSTQVGNLWIAIRDAPTDEEKETLNKEMGGFRDLYIQNGMVGEWVTLQDQLSKAPQNVTQKHSWNSSEKLRNEVTNILNDPSTKTQKEQDVLELMLQNNWTLDVTTKKLIQRKIDNFSKASSTSSFKRAERSFIRATSTLLQKHKISGADSATILSLIAGDAVKSVPRELHTFILKAHTRMVEELQELFAESENEANDKEVPHYGYLDWTLEDRKAWQKKVDDFVGKDILSYMSEADELVKQVQEDKTPVDPRIVTRKEITTLFPQTVSTLKVEMNKVHGLGSFLGIDAQGDVSASVLASTLSSIVNNRLGKGKWSNDSPFEDWVDTLVDDIGEWDRDDKRRLWGTLEVDTIVRKAINWIKFLINKKAKYEIQQLEGDE